MDKKQLKELNKWKKYNIKVTFKELKPIKGKSDIQMLLYFDNDLVYTTRKNTFTLTTYKTKKLKSFKKRFLDWKDWNDWYEEEYEILSWDKEEFAKFNKWCSNFRICTQILESVKEQKEKDFKKRLNLE